MSGDELRLRRESLGMTQQDMAVEFGVSRLSVIRWENGHTRIRVVYERALRDLERVGPVPLDPFPRVPWTSPRRRRMTRV